MTKRNSNQNHGHTIEEKSNLTFFGIPIRFIVVAGQFIAGAIFAVFTVGVFFGDKLSILENTKQETEKLTSDVRLIQSRLSLTENDKLHSTQFSELVKKDILQLRNAITNVEISSATSKTDIENARKNLEMMSQKLASLDENQSTRDRDINDRLDNIYRLILLKTDIIDAELSSKHEEVLKLINEERSRK